MSELLDRFDLSKCDGISEFSDWADLNHDSCLVVRIGPGIGGNDHLADNRLLLAGVIKEDAVSLLHLS